MPPGVLVALLVTGYLSSPEVGVGLGNSVVGTILVAMPETAVNEDDGAILGGKYSGGSSITASSPYYWQKVMYEYNGMNCKTTTQTSKYGLPAGTPYEEEITEATYW